MRLPAILLVPALFALSLVAVAAPGSAAYHVESPGSGLCVLPVGPTFVCLPEPRECLDQPAEDVLRCLAPTRS